MNLLRPSAAPTQAAPCTGEGAFQPALRQSARRELLAFAVGLLLLALVTSRVAGLGADYIVKALLLYTAAATLAWRALRSGTHPFPRWGPANRVTTLRLMLVALLAALIGESLLHPPLQATPLTWGIVVLATVTALLDAVDGALARRSGLSSAFGGRFDMETDAALTLVLCGLVWQSGQAGAWVLAAGLMRYAFVAAAWRWTWLAAPLAPSSRRQTVCVVQITTLIVCLGPIVPQTLATALAGCSLALLCLSFAVDIRQLAQQRRPQQGA